MDWLHFWFLAKPVIEHTLLFSIAIREIVILCFNAICLAYSSCFQVGGYNWLLSINPFDPFVLEILLHKRQVLSAAKQFTLYSIKLIDKIENWRAYAITSKQQTLIGEQVVLGIFLELSGWVCHIYAAEKRENDFFSMAGVVGKTARPGTRPQFSNLNRREKRI